MSIFSSFVSASSWSLPGIKIITRAERWANEARRYSTTSKTERDALRKQQSDSELNNLMETDYDKYLEADKWTIATEYLLDTTPTEQVVDEYRESSDGNFLKRPESIHTNKSKIIIHHTAEDDTSLLTWWHEAVLKALQNIYKYHALTRWRGDIGYNFIIDPYGNIYEGRAWWAWVVWAHVSWNNTPTVGIALMGNFNVNVPTDQALKSLVKLVTALSKKYKINPQSTVTYFKKSDTFPYLKSYTNYAVAWHTDAWITSCPWTNLYALFPDIRDQVSKNLSAALLISTRTVTKPATLVQRWISLAWRYYSDSSTSTFILPIRWKGVSSCTTTDSTIVINSCTSQNNQLVISLTKKWSSGIKTISVMTNSWTKTFSMNLIRQDDFATIANQTKTSYSNRKSISPASQSINKITSKIHLSDISTLLKSPLNILLYELSTSYSRYETSCDWWCSIQADGKTYTDDSPIIETSNGFIYLTLPTFENALAVAHLEITPLSWGMLYVNNYTRKSYGGTPWNIFRWSLVRTKDSIKNLDSGKFIDQAVVINKTSFENYMQGIAETSDSDNIIKQKLILLLAKMYTLFYIGGKNIHPSIPVWASYQAIDNPDMFQKYVWAWREKTSKLSATLLSDIKDTLVMYDDYVPILPYFSCSAWFTRSAREKRWWNDTPYLQSKLDFSACLDFNGHGVWLSGKWAQFLADKGWTLEQILQYYYPWVQLVSINE